MEEQRKVLFEAKDLCKEFGPTIALNHVDLTVYGGEIRGLIGENGSGKSTISSIAAGMQPATSGEMFFEGKPHKPASMLDGAAAGIGMIVQEMGTIEGITVAQNIFLGNEDQFKRGPFISRSALNKAAKEALMAIGADDIEPGTLINRLNMQDRKLVEVAKVMYAKPRILVVDETTTALSQKGRQIIYKLMKQMKEAGNAVLFISHDLNEVMEQCDTLTVLRDGVMVATLEKKDFEEGLVKKYMVGREIGEHYYREDTVCSYEDETVVKVERLTTGHGMTKNVSLELHKGEILGIGGLSHCGMHELGKAIFGGEPVLTGSVTYLPENKVIDNCKTAMKCGFGYVSKDRDHEALVLTADIRDNIVGAAMDKLAKHGFITPRAEKRHVNEMVQLLSIRCAGIGQQVKFLSGGNKQKVVFGKWIGRRSSVLVLDCPTRGVDIGVKAAMYQLMEEIKSEGKSILMISEELTELIGMCDRILIMKDGQINGEMIRGQNFDENTAIEYMI